MKGIHFFKALSQDKLQKLISVFTQKEIAEMFDCNESCVSKFLSDTFSIKHVETNKTMFDGVPIYKTVGCWMDSEARICIKQIK
jgi:hypothetical protein